MAVIDGKNRGMKICIACSTGGHLLQALRLRGAYDNYIHFFVTAKRADAEFLAKENKVYFVADPARNLFKFMLNALQAFRVFVRERPDVVISTGASTALPMCVWSKLCRRKIIFIESFSRVTRPTWTGRLVYSWTDLFLVQWQDLGESYPRALYTGAVL